MAANINGQYGLYYQGTGQMAGYGPDNRKGFLNGFAERKEAVPTQQGGGAHMLTRDELASANGSRLGDDMIAIMRDVDPKAYEEYQQIAKEGAASGTQEGMVAGLRYEISWMEKKAGENPKWVEEYKAAQEAKNSSPIKGSESKLSKKAADLLADLRKTYGDDFDFIVGDPGDDLHSLAKNSSKEFTVIFSSDELEKMAADEYYAKEKIDSLHNAVRMSKQINEEFCFEGSSEAGANSRVQMTRFGVAYHSDGSVTYFAELEKSLAKQKERLEKSNEKRAEEKREADRKENPPVSAKRVMVEASSPEELIEKIKQIDWSETNTDPIPESGRRFDSRA